MTIAALAADRRADKVIRGLEGYSEIDLIKTRKLKIDVSENCI
jgi:hypothetical protein